VGAVKATHAWLPVALLVILALTRIPGLLPPNFSAVYALLFCAGAYFRGRLGWMAPLGMVVVTDLLLNAYYGGTPWRWETLGNYAAYGALIGLGRRFSRGSAWLALLGGGVLGAVLFYVVTNTISWLLDAAYTKDLAGWIQALTVGRPEFPHTWEFFRSTLLSGGLFTGLFAGAMKLGEAAEAQEEAEAETEETEGTEEAPEEAPQPGRS
jgi:hypothetical protein